MASPASKMSESKVKLKEAENDLQKQMEMLESSSMPQAIAVFSHYGEEETVGQLRMQHVRHTGARGHVRDFSANKEGKVIAIDKLLAGCIPKDTSTAVLGAWVDKFVALWAQVVGGQAFINLAYTRVLLDRLRNGGSVEPHPVLVEEVCSGNVAALGADELQQAAEFQKDIMKVLEKKKDSSKITELDDGDLSEIAVDRPVIPDLGVRVQTRAADGEDWSAVAVVVKVSEDDHLGELKIVGSEGSKVFQTAHWAPMHPPLMRRAPESTKADAKFGSGGGASTDDFSGKQS